jgi:glycosyltransferase involved in cell wall biosynthesis
MLLAIVDTHFPFMASGFRYWENFEFHKTDKSILFFSANKMSDPFPAEVHSLSSITNYPITDIYCVFLNHTLGLLDCPLKIPGKQNYGISKFIIDNGISIHTSIYPGGGYEEVTHLKQATKGLEFLRDHSNVKSVFTFVEGVQQLIPKKSYRTENIVNTSFFKYSPRSKSNKLHLLFAAFPPSTRAQKGLCYLIEAFNSLDPSKYHLHIVGDWKTDLQKIKHKNYTFYGNLPQDKLREVFHKCHVAINPAYKVDIPYQQLVLSRLGRLIPVHTRFVPRGEIYASIDAFPLVVSGEAMSSGCCLISTNHRHDYHVLSPGRDYIEIKEKSSTDLAKAVEYLYKNQDKMLTIASRGRERVAESLDVRKIVAFKYDTIKRNSKVS